MRIVFLVTLLACTIIATAPPVSGQQPGSADKITIGSPEAVELMAVTETGANGMVMEARPHVLQGRLVENSKGKFLDLDLPSGRTVEIGHPALPALRTFVDIPLGARNVKARVLSEDWTEYRLSDICDAEYLMPAQASVPKIEGALERAEFAMNAKAYETNAFTPVRPVEITPAGFMRGHRLMTIAVHPLQYNPALGTVRLCTKIRFEITYQDADLEATERLRKRYDTPQLDLILEKNVVNHAAGSRDAIPLPVGFLIVTHTDFAAGIQPFADWKDHIGYDVTVVTTAQTGSTAAQIKTYIQDAYNTWVIPPQFVLLVGDSNFVPGFNGGKTGYITDLDYTLMDGDFLPDLYIGRFSVTTNMQLQNILAKTLGYEQVDWSYLAWMKMACFMASVDNYNISEGTHNYVIDNYLDPAGYTCDKLYQVTYGATTQDVRDALNAGRSLAIYSGHGSTTSWADGPPFSQSDVNNLTNADMYPFVCSHACLTGDFEHPECFAETWQRAAGKGALVFWGSAPSSYWDEDDILEKGMFHAAYADGIYWITGMTNMGLMAVNNYYGGAGRTEYYYEAYHVFGDPSLLLRTEEPLALDVTHDEAINIGLGTVSVDVSMGGSPVENALVHAAKDGEVFVSVYTDAAGHVDVPVSTTTPGDMDLVVTAHNGIPYEGHVLVFVPTGPYVVLNDYTIDDAAGGNNDGDIDIGETIELPVAGKNVGVAMAYDVTATLSTIDPEVTITDDTETFGDIDADQIVWSADDFDFSVSPLCEDGRLVPFTVTFTDNASNTWDYTLMLTVNAPDVLYDEYMLDDVVGNGDGIADPGETVHFDVTLLNDGHHVAENVTVELHTSDTYCTITQNTSAYDDILPDATGLNLATLSADIGAATPVGHKVVVNVDIYRDGNLTGSGQFDFVVSRIPVLLIDLDENHNSAPAIESTLASLGVTYETTQSWSANFELYTSLFVCLGIYSDNTSLSTAQATALVDFMQAGHNVYMEGGDCWYYDSSANIYTGAFGIDGISDGTSDTGTIIGQLGTIAGNLNFQYAGDNNYMDHISALPGADLIFKNQAPSYGNGVAYDAGDYRSVGVSFEFGGLNDSPMGTKLEWMTRMLEYFGILNLTLSADASTLSEMAGGQVNFTLSAGSDNASRTYYMLGGVSGSTPGTVLPGGTAVLPLNWDVFTDMVISFWNTPYLVDFFGTLDANGHASATFDTVGPLPGGAVGTVMSFAYACPYMAPGGWFASNAVHVEIVR